MSLSRRPLAWLAGLAMLTAGLTVPAHLARADTVEPGGPDTWALVPASAEGPDGRAVLEYIVDPEQAYTDHVAVRNLGEQALTVSLHAQDAVQGPDGGFDLSGPEDQAAQVGAWVELETTQVTVPPREHVIVPFTLDIPADAEPGDHAGGIVAVSQVEDGAGPAVQYRVGTRVHIRVAGPVDAALDVDALRGHHETRWTPFAAAPLDVDATLVNTGNVRVTPQARINVSGLFGWWSDSAPLAGIDELLPGGEQGVTARLTDVPPIGPLWVTVDVVEVSSRDQDLTEATTVSSRTVVVWAVPWVLAGAIVLLLAAGVIAIVNLRRRAAARRTPTAPPGTRREDPTATTSSSERDADDQEAAARPRPAAP